MTAILLAGVSACSRDPLQKLYGTWKGKTVIDQDITVTIGADSTVAIETENEGVRQRRSGTYQIVDRRMRISLTSLVISGDDSTHTVAINDQDEAVFTLTYENELVLRRGGQVMVLHREER